MNFMKMFWGSFPLQEGAQFEYSKVELVIKNSKPTPWDFTPAQRSNSYLQNYLNNLAVASHFASLLAFLLCIFRDFVLFLNLYGEVHSL